MNKYGKHAQETWKILAPTQYAQIPDPEAYFTTLGEDAETSVGDLLVQIAGPDPKGETCLQEVGRLNAARAQAEEIVGAEMLTPQDQDSTDEDEDSEDEPSPISIDLKFMREFRPLHRELVEELNQIELDRDRPDLSR
ncbi:TnpV protein [Microbacterium sp. A93]|uniref:TnpV protein n=1 Tax=Microbacterium sp. A93 TaxID=3450716 RepID=UPI003F43D0AB